MPNDKSTQNGPRKEKKRSDELSRRDLLGSTAAGVAVAGIAAVGFTGNLSAAPDSGSVLDHLRPDSSQPSDDKSGAPKTGDRAILIKGGCVLTMDPDIGDFVEADVLIEDKQIVAVQPDLTKQGRGAQKIDASGMIVMPGFVDAHRHCWGAILGRMIGNGPSLADDYVVLTHNGTAPFYRPIDLYAANFLSGLRTIDCGITSVLDFCHNVRSTEHADAAIQAHLDSGVRAVFGYGGALSGNWDHQWPADMTRVKQQFFASEDQLVTLRMATGLDATNFQLARSIGVKISVDPVFLSEVFVPGVVQTLENFASQGLLGEDVTLIHGVALPDSSFQLIKDTGTKLCLAPCSDAHYRGLGDSITPVQKALDFKLPTGLSIDTETSLPPDMFANMRQALYLQRVMASKRVADGDPHAPDPMSPQQVLRMATIGGAMCNGLEDKIGTLTPGKQADIIMIDASNIMNLPLNYAIGTVVMATDTTSIRNVLIAGRIKKWKGELVGVNLNKVRKLVTASRDYLAQQSGLWHTSDIVGDGAYSSFSSSLCCHGPA